MSKSLPGLFVAIVGMGLVSTAAARTPAQYCATTATGSCELLNMSLIAAQSGSSSVNYVTLKYCRNKAFQAVAYKFANSSIFGDEASSCSPSMMTGKCYVMAPPLFNNGLCSASFHSGDPVLP